ncbi:hypothetical protein B0H15DRAFT_805737 [Mycena belliarum]|uniref:Uncharacterized protein n=1 Tax=Mycena belliarum TaxID=1033014 RepID=A0AAD6TRL7_9AGAR|nr:hypothetical protein B0H15DRAFT_805737 [Mycena belliae]
MSGTAVLAYSDIGSHSFEYTSVVEQPYNTDDVVNPDSSSEPRIRIPRSVSPAPRTQPGLMLAPFQIAQIGRRGDTPNSICAGRRDQAAHRARKARATSPTPALRTSHRSRPRPSSLVSSAGSSSESAGNAACEHERTNGGPRSLPPPPSHRSRPRPSSLVSSAGSSSESAGNAACEHERTNGGPRSLPPPPSHRTAADIGPPSSQFEPGVGCKGEHRASSVPPTPSHRTAADIGPPSSQFEPGVGCKGEHRASSVPPTPSHRTAADIGPPSSQFEPGVGCKGEHRASSVPPTPSHRASLVSSAESSSESEAKAASTNEQRPAHALLALFRFGCEGEGGCGVRSLRAAGFGTRDSGLGTPPRGCFQTSALGIGIWEGSGSGREPELGERRREGMAARARRSEARRFEGVEQAGRDRVRKAQGASMRREWDCAPAPVDVEGGAHGSGAGDAAEWIAHGGLFRPRRVERWSGLVTGDGVLRTLVVVRASRGRGPAANVRRELDRAAQEQRAGVGSVASERAAAGV